MKQTWLHAQRAIVGDGHTVISPAWVGFEGKYITCVTDKQPAEATPDCTVELGSATLTPA